MILVRSSIENLETAGCRLDPSNLTQRVNSETGDQHLSDLISVRDGMGNFVSWAIVQALQRAMEIDCEQDESVDLDAKCEIGKFLTLATELIWARIHDLEESHISDLLEQ